ncbi:MAG TPA: hypothetical protein DEF45_21655, partial [Rhodopirellula sp.]|nr:hypothetical protein [Rhodopirellula sp.]
GHDSRSTFDCIAAPRVSDRKLIATASNQNQLPAPLNCEYPNAGIGNQESGTTKAWILKTGIQSYLHD